MVCSKCGRVCQDTEKFCAACGNPMNQVIQNTVPVNQVPNYSNQVMYNSPVTNYVEPKKSNSVLYACSGIIMAAIIAIVVMISIHDDSSVYFSDDGYMNGEVVPTISSGKKYETAIETFHDHTVDIYSKNDTIKLLVNDSEEERKKCPKEIQTIENRIVNNYKITAVNLCELDLDFAREIESAIKYIYDKYPKARGYLANISLDNDTTMNTGAIAYFWGGHQYTYPINGDAISVNLSVSLITKYFLNPTYLEQQMKLNSEAGHFPPNAKKEGVMVHELAHYLSFVVSLIEYDIDSTLYLDSDGIRKYNSVLLSRSNKSYEILQAAYKNYQAKYHDNMDFDDWRATISRYAVSKDANGNYQYDETIAEAFHDVYNNGSKAKPASIEIEAELGRRLR